MLRAQPSRLDTRVQPVQSGVQAIFRAADDVRYRGIASQLVIAIRQSSTAVSCYVLMSAKRPFRVPSLPPAFQLRMTEAVIALRHGIGRIA
jgi:hypothetical protein